MNPQDPDRFFNRTSPGAHEWWYFDAISDDGRETIVIVFYAGLPFDPSYGVATLRHLKNPARHPQPSALDHSAIGFSRYSNGDGDFSSRDTLVYALNGYRAGHFRYQADPFRVDVASSRVERDGGGYRLTIDTPAVDGKPILAEFRFTPAGSTEPFERNLGTLEAPHNWVLSAADCRVEGHSSIGGKSSKFVGRGYHDHNAGAEDLSIAMNRWEWGRFHHGPLTTIYYWSEPKNGQSQSLWLTCRDGRPEAVREKLVMKETKDWQRNVFGVRHRDWLWFSGEGGGEGEALGRRPLLCLDDGPFYRRWKAQIQLKNPVDPDSNEVALGIAELLDTRNLHKPWFNWMIPYRLKWPRS